MKNKILLAVLAIALALEMTACGNGSTNSTPVPKMDTYTGVAEGAEYTLEITQKSARFAVLADDIYELKAGSKTSKGVVSEAAEGGKLTLKPNDVTETFTVTVSGSSISKIEGTITWSDNSKDEDVDITLTPKGGTNPVTPPGGGSGSISGVWEAVDWSGIGGTTITFSGSNYTLAKPDGTELAKGTYTLASDGKDITFKQTSPSSATFTGYYWPNENPPTITSTVAGGSNVDYHKKS
ncbi:MAG: hypothetical protein LBU82_00625 [Treponema sp.]|jgi:hypothetical protein|nr:hypothetical protein [Treponema sp.]